MLRNMLGFLGATTKKSWKMSHMFGFWCRCCYFKDSSLELCLIFGSTLECSTSIIFVKGFKINDDAVYAWEFEGISCSKISLWAHSTCFYVFSLRSSRPLHKTASNLSRSNHHHVESFLSASAFALNCCQQSYGSTKEHSEVMCACSS